MAQILTSQQILNESTAFTNIDLLYFESNINHWQETVLKSLLTDTLYAEFITETTAGTYSAANQILFDNYIKYAMPYGVAYLAMKKDITTQLTNQGVMGNRTDYANSERNSTVLKEFKEREFEYLKALGVYLLDNKATYPLFIYKKTYLGVDFRDTIIL
jgi:hypothetical protein